MGKAAARAAGHDQRQLSALSHIEERGGAGRVAGPASQGSK